MCCTIAVLYKLYAVGCTQHYTPFLTTTAQRVYIKIQRNKLTYTEHTQITYITEPYTRTCPYSMMIYYAFALNNT